MIESETNLHMLSVFLGNFEWLFLWILGLVACPDGTPAKVSDIVRVLRSVTRLY